MGCGALSVLAVFQPLRRDDQYEIHVLVGTERSHLEAQEVALRICKFSIFPNSTQTSIQGSFLLLCLFKLFQFGGNQSLLCTDHAHGIAGCVGWACRDIHCIAGCGVGVCTGAAAWQRLHKLLWLLCSGACSAPTPGSTRLPTIFQLCRKTLSSSNQMHVVVFLRSEPLAQAGFISTLHAPVDEDGK